MKDKTAPAGRTVPTREQAAWPTCLGLAYGLAQHRVLIGARERHQITRALTPAQVREARRLLGAGSSY